MTRRINVETVPSDLLPPGSKFTMAGCGIGAKGQTVFGGYNVATKRKCKAVVLTVFTAGKTVVVGGR